MYDLASTAGAAPDPLNPRSEIDRGMLRLYRDHTNIAAGRVAASHVSTWAEDGAKLGPLLSSERDASRRPDSAPRQRRPLDDDLRASGFMTATYSSCFVDGGTEW